MNILITGASSGIGRAIALEMTSDKHKFFLISRNKEKLTKIKREVEERGGIAYIGTGDVAKFDQVLGLYEEAKKYLGNIDVLIANAGVGFLFNLEDTPLEKYELMFDTNVKGVFLWLKMILPDMKRKNKGQIIITSSTAGFQTFSQGSVYCATKHAIQGMAGALRKELIGTRVKIATINPGAVNTPWFDHQSNFSGFDRSKMLSARDVAKAVRLVIEQSETCNIDHILLTH
ncbi:MAG: SDR family oxidoreductase [Promethearchaeota archaeon]